MGDRGLPKSYRTMNGYSSHTFMWINAAGDKHWVKYHYETDQGIENYTEDEGAEVAGMNPDAHRQDLSEAIAAGDYPSWTMYVQIMPFDDAKTYRFNPFDLTKVWPPSDYPLRKVGTFQLNRNPDNFFADIEQSSFEPSNFISGIGPSPDKMLQGRLFSYPDAHRYRIGVNYLQLPVNAPKSPVHSYNKDGQMRYSNPADPVYAPNSTGGPAADTDRFGEEGGYHLDGEMMRSAYVAHPQDDDFGQPRTMWNTVMDEAARERTVSNVVGHMNKGITPEIGDRVVGYWTKVAPDLGERVAKKYASA